jgi:L,D-transpeptidase ErfK/SrfK
MRRIVGIAGLSSCGVKAEPRWRGFAFLLPSKAVAIGVSLLAACAARHGAPPPAGAPLLPLEKITTVRTVVPARGHLPGLVGHMQRHRIQTKETLLDVARDAGLGFNEVHDANRGVDEWIPPAGLEVLVPTQWIVPRSSYRGVVVNIPEMRLYLFPSKATPGAAVALRTWAIGIGTGETPSPVGQFRVTAKDQHPTWYVPDSIYQTMDRPKRHVVPPGPDNPLGDYRIRLSKGLYSIHGTDIPWSVGRLTTHGCLRLYPEDISELFPLVRRGTVGELLYQPIKFGESDGELYVEVHEDLYKRIPNMQREARALARKAGLMNRIDLARLRQAVAEKRGVPVVVTRRPPEKTLAQVKRP